jgi:hypothetical protein
MSDRYHLVLRDEPGDLDHVPVDVRLRAALKRLLRTHGLRCESIQYESSKPNEPTENGTESNGDAFSGGGMTKDPSEAAKCGKRAKERQQREIEVF